MTGILRVPRRLALAAITVLVSAASAVSFAESYRGLFDWAAGHGLGGVWAVLWPCQVDVFIAVGELALFVGLADQWDRRSRIGAWTVTLAGLAVSVAGNVGHIASHSPAARATAAVPPLAAAAALAVGLGVLKRVVAAHHKAAGRKGAAVASRDRQATGQAGGRSAPGGAPVTRSGTRSASRRKHAARGRARRRADADLEAEALAILAGQPEMSGAALGRAMGASPRTGQRLRARLAAPDSTE